MLTSLGVHKQPTLQEVLHLLILWATNPCSSFEANGGEGSADSSSRLVCGRDSTPLTSPSVPAGLGAPVAVGNSFFTSRAQMKALYSFLAYEAKRDLAAQV